MMSNQLVASLRQGDCSLPSTAGTKLLNKHTHTFWKSKFYALQHMV